ncbi:MAG TPA: hypothetical protein VJC10_01235 [Patescibacteria group bacterium]|nr:hypothetical protein [Patescibacteria group bacterium]
MQSFLIIGTDQDLLQNQLNTLYQAYDVLTIDRTILSTDILIEETKSEKLSIGIAEIKKIQKKIILKPIKSKTKAVVILDAQNLTIQAQNALLKTLEEPPNNTIIVLVAPTIEVFLPTVLSRCTIIVIDEPNKHAGLAGENLEEVLQTIPGWEVGQRLKQAEILAKEKQTAGDWIEKAILSTRNLLRNAVEKDEKETITQLKHMAKIFQAYGRDIQTTNVNLRLALENMFLAL